jgi:hypothetical protein
MDVRVDISGSGWQAIQRELLQGSGIRNLLSSTFQSRNRGIEPLVKLQEVKGRRLVAVSKEGERLKKMSAAERSIAYAERVLAESTDSRKRYNAHRILGRYQKG